MRKFILLGVLVSMLAAGNVVSATEAPPLPEKSVSDLETITATVKEIDPQTRVVTIEGPDGNTLTTKVDDDVPNLNKVKKGDKVEVVLYNSLAISLEKNKEKKDIVKETKQVTVTAVVKKKPVKVETEQVTMVVDIDKVNKTKGTVTVTGIKNVPVEIKVQDPKNLDIIKAGDQAVITYQEAVAVAVTKK